MPRDYYEILAVSRDAGENEELTVAIGNVVEDTAEDGPHLAGPGGGTVEHIGERGQDHQHHPPEPHPVPEKDPRRDGAEERDGGQEVGGQAELEAAPAEYKRGFFVPLPLALVDGRFGLLNFRILHWHAPNIRPHETGVNQTRQAEKSV